MDHPSAAAGSTPSDRHLTDPSSPTAHPPEQSADAGPAPEVTPPAADTHARPGLDGSTDGSTDVPVKDRLGSRFERGSAICTGDGDPGWPNPDRTAPSGDMNDLCDRMVQQMFGVSLDLHAALVSTGDHYLAERIAQAISGLDQTINDLRNMAFRLHLVSVPPQDSSHSPDQRFA